MRKAQKRRINMQQKHRPAKSPPACAINQIFFHALIVAVDFKAHIIAQGFFQNIGHMAAADGDVMLKAIVANVVHQILKALHMAQRQAALGGDRIVAEIAFAYIALDLAVFIVGGDLGKGHGTGRNLGLARAEALVRADGGAQHVQVGNFDGLLEKALGEVGAVEADAAVAVVAPVVIPVQISRALAGGKAHGVHGDRAGDVQFAGAGHALVAHHAHGKAGGTAVIVLNGIPAFDRACHAVAGSDPVFQRQAQLGLAEHLFLGNRIRDRAVSLDLFHFIQHTLVNLHLRGGGNDFGHAAGLDGDAALLEQLFGITNRAERVGAGTDGGNTRAFQPGHNAADRSEFFNIPGERCRNQWRRYGGWSGCI